MHDFLHRSGRHRVAGIIAMTLGGLALAALLGFGLGWLVQWLWNTLAVAIFKLPAITYWQAVGLFILCKLLFGGLGGHGHQGRSRCRTRRDRAHFRDFWEAEGRQAFERYRERKASPGQEPAPRGGE